jgi:hypothetical protein
MLPPVVEDFASGIAFASSTVVRVLAVLIGPLGAFAGRRAVLRHGQMMSELNSHVKHEMYELSTKLHLDLLSETNHNWRQHENTRRNFAFRVAQEACRGSRYHGRFGNCSLGLLRAVVQAASASGNHLRSAGR